MDRKQQKALSLVELLTTLGILGVLTSLAVPAFSDQIKRSRDESQVTLMLSTLHLARSEAIKRHTFVALCSGESCENRHWRQQLQMFTDSNRNGQLDPNETLLRIVELDERYHWHWLQLPPTPPCHLPGQRDDSCTQRHPDAVPRHPSSQADCDQPLRPAKATSHFR